VLESVQDDVMLANLVYRFDPAFTLRNE